MGWGRTLLLGDIGNRLDIEDTEREIARLQHIVQAQAHTDASHDERLASLEQENAELKLYVAGLVGVLRRQGVVTEAEIRTLVEGIDPGKR